MPDAGVAVAVEDHGAVLFDDMLHIVLDGRVEILAAGQVAFQEVGRVTQRVGHDGVQGRDGTGSGLAGAQGAELETVTREGDGAGAVAVAGVRGQGRQGIHAHVHDTAALAVGGIVDTAGTEGFEHFRQLVAQEDGHDGRRGFVGAQTVVVAGAGHSGTQQAAELVHGTDHGRTEHQELGVGVRGLAGVEQRAQFGITDGVVHVLARAVDAVEGLFVQQALEPVTFGHVAQGGHDDVVVVHGQVAGLKQRRDLVLAGGGFIVAGAHGHAQFVELAFHFHHVGQHALGDDPEVLVAEFLALGRTGAEQRTSRHLQVGTGKVEVVVDAEIFLLQTGIGDHRQLGLDAEQLQHAAGLTVEGLAGTQQRGLLVQGHTGPGKEHGGDAQEGPVGVFHDVGGAGHVPGRIAARLKGGAQAAGGEGRGVGLAADQHGAGKFGDDAALSVRHQEAVVLFRRLTGQGIEDMGEVGGTFFYGPVLHDGGHGIGDAGIHALAELDGLVQGLVDILGQAFTHHLVGEHVTAENVGGLGVVEVQRRRFRLVGGDGLNGTSAGGIAAHESSLVNVREPS